MLFTFKEKVTKFCPNCGSELLKIPLDKPLGYIMRGNNGYVLPSNEYLIGCSKCVYARLKDRKDYDMNYKEYLGQAKIQELKKIKESIKNEDTNTGQRNSIS